MIPGMLWYGIRSHQMNIEKLLFNKSFESKNRKLVDHVRSLSGRQKKAEIETHNK